MSYKANRVGTDHIYETLPTSAAQDIADPFIPNAEYVNQSINPTPLDIAGTAFTQFGSVKLRTTNTGNLSTGSSVGFGQSFSLPEVILGNEYLLEVGCSVQGHIPEGIALNHMFGSVETPAAGAYQTATMDFIPMVLNSQPPVARTGVAVAYRTYTHYSPVVTVDNPLNGKLFMHYLELRDARQVGGAALPISNLRATFWIRGIHHADLLLPYDPVR
jgi:hypothetical protein